MRVSWWFKPRLGQHRARRRRTSAAAPLRVRQLERRRVLDAALQSLVVGPTIVAEDSATTSTATDQQPMVFDWQGTESGAQGAGSAEHEADSQNSSSPLPAPRSPLSPGDDASQTDAPPDSQFATSTESALIAAESSAANTRPVLIVAANQTINEGQLLNMSGIGAPPLGLFVDPDLADTHTATVNWGDGTATEMATIFAGVGSGAIGGTHTYHDNGVYTVIVTVMDNHGASDTRSFQVTVLNVAPELTDITGDTVNEGHEGLLPPARPATIGMTIVDPSPTDVFTVDVNWMDGRAATITGLSQTDSSGTVGDTSYEWTAATRRLELSHWYLDDGPSGVDSFTYNVQLVVSDGFDSSVADTNVTVNNLPPFLFTQSDQIVEEGQPLDFSGVTGPPLAVFVDNGKLDTHTAIIIWGDGSPVESATVFQGMGAGALGGSHVYADNGVYTVIVRLADDDMGAYADPDKFITGVAGVDYVERTFTVTVLNVPPYLTGIDNLEVNEGDFFTLADLGVGLADPGFDNPHNPLTPGGSTEQFAAWMIDWGDGSPLAPVTIVDRLSGSPGVPTTAMFDHVQHVYADDGLYTVTIRVADDDMPGFHDPSKFVTGVAGVDYVQLEFQILVTNVAPELTITSVTPDPGVIQEAGAVGFTASFSDAGFDNPNNPLVPGGSVESFTIDIDWGDGRHEVVNMPTPYTAGSPGVASTGAFGASHIYADDGVYTVTITVRDDDGGYDTKTFTVIVENVDPSFVPTAGGAPFEGHDVTPQGFTTIRVSFTDPGFDNPANLNPADPALFITDPRHETFTHLMDWGDGTIDAIHTYVQSGVYTVTVTVIGPGGTQTHSFAGFNSSSPHAVLTLVSSQAINDPAVATQSFTYIVNWGDGVEQTISLMLKAPGAPLFNNGLTTIISSERTSGDEGVLTTGSFEVRHRYLGPPNPLNPTANIPITVTIVDDNLGIASDFITIRQPGIQTINVAIDTTPQVPRLDFTPPPPAPVLLDQGASSIQSLQTAEPRVVSGDTGIASERYLELVVLSPDGEVVERYRIEDEALLDLRQLFATLPDGHYQIYLVRTDNNSRRLVIEVFVRGGRVIDPADDSEGTRDRPPTSDSSQIEALPLDENALLKAVPDGEPLSLRSLRWGLPLAALGLAAGRGGWSRRLEAALQQADDRTWQRLRRAGRRGNGPR